jgi:spore maturation protein CgeB
LLKILCIGEEWRGSNASGLFHALSRIGHKIEIVNELNYISVYARNKITKFLNRLVRKYQIKDFNSQLVHKILHFEPDLVLIYKGAFILPRTLKTFKNLGYPVVNFYPDVSLFTHGKLIPETINYYDHIFTTKSFAINDLKEKFGFHKTSFIPHGFDPTLHNTSKVSTSSKFTCDVSFIGTWSPKKEQILSALKEALPEIGLKIWGNQWNRVNTKKLIDAIQNTAVIGDQYVEAIQHSKINLALLSEKRSGSSSGDLITSRTFHIPGSGGFMIHERTKDIHEFFIEDKEIGCFGDEEELIQKIRFFLVNEKLRSQYLKSGLERSKKDHSLDIRAKQLLAILNKMNIINN